MRHGVVLAMMLSVSAVSAQVIDRVLATVDGKLVTLSDVRVTDEFELLAGAQTVEQQLDRWIERLLILQEVERFAPPEPEGAAIAKGVAAAVERLGPPDVASQRLARLGVNEEWLRQWVRDDLRISAYIEQRFAGVTEPTGEELENYYRQNPSEFVREGRELSPAEASALARERVMASRRRVLLAEWLDGLRRRATIVRPRR